MAIWTSCDTSRRYHTAAERLEVQAGIKSNSSRIACLAGLNSKLRIAYASNDEWKIKQSRREVHIDITQINSQKTRDYFLISPIGI